MCFAAGWPQLMQFEEPESASSSSSDITIADSTPKKCHRQVNLSYVSEAHQTAASSVVD